MMAGSNLSMRSTNPRFSAIIHGGEFDIRILILMVVWDMRSEAEIVYSLFTLFTSMPC